MDGRSQVMNHELIDVAQRAGIMIAGSIIGLPTEDRAEAASRLWSRGCWVHADVVDGSYGQRSSVGVDEIVRLAQGRGAVDVHLMVDEPARWIEQLPRGLARITIQADRIPATELRTAIVEARRYADSVWIAVHRPERPPVETIAGVSDVDGVLFVLAPPAVDGHELDPANLARPGEAVGPHGVDGGVRTDHLPAIAATGAVYAVSGRGLFES